MTPDDQITRRSVTISLVLAVFLKVLPLEADLVFGFLTDGRTDVAAAIMVASTIAVLCPLAIVLFKGRLHLASLISFRFFALAAIVLLSLLVNGYAVARSLNR